MGYKYIINYYYYLSHADKKRMKVTFSQDIYSNACQIEAQQMQRYVWELDSKDQPLLVLSYILSMPGDRARKRSTLIKMKRSILVKVSESKKKNTYYVSPCNNLKFQFGVFKGFEARKIRDYCF